MVSTASTAEDYLRELPAARAEVVSVVRDLVNEHLPAGYVETMDDGMITWVVPLELYPDTYNGRPFLYVGLAARKSYTSLYLMPLYNGGPIDESQLRARWSAPRALDMGKACVRFTRAEDLDLPLLAEVVGSVPLEAYVEGARAVRSRRR